MADDTGVSNTTQTELPRSGNIHGGGYVAEKNLADKVFDMTTAIFLLRKTMEEMHETHLRALLAYEWYMTTTYEEFGG